MNMSSSGQQHISRDQVLVAHAVEMIARTGFSQDDFAQALSSNLHRQIPEKATSKDVPDFKLLVQGNDTAVFLRASGAWLRRVGRWLSGEVDLPSWLEEASGSMLWKVTFRSAASTSWPADRLTGACAYR